MPLQLSPTMVGHEKLDVQCCSGVALLRAMSVYA